MRERIASLLSLAGRHKVLASVFMAGIALLGYLAYSAFSGDSDAVRYVVATAKKETIVTSISGSGQVSAQNQIDIKSRVAGEIVALPFPEGSKVHAGDAIARIDASDAAKAVRDASVSLDSARLSLQKLEQPSDELSLAQAENSLARASTSRQNALDSLEKAYSDSFNDVADAFLDLPGVVSGLHDLLYTPNNQLGGQNVNNIDFYSSSATVFDPRGTSFGTDADKKYKIAKSMYDKSFADYKALDRSASESELEDMVTRTYETALAISDAVKSANNLIQFYEDQMTVHSQKIPALANTQLSTLSGYTGIVNGHLTELLSIATTIKNSKSTIIDTERTIRESEKSYAKLIAGTDPLDLASARLTVTTRQNALRDAEESLADYMIRAPFDGTLAKVSVKRYDTASNGTTIGTIIGSSRIAEISLNEVDAAKVAVGDKATLTFDAIDDLTLTGKVASVDTIGTISQGVVTYSVRIAFDADDARIRSGMSVNASIIIDMKADALAVPNSAVKTDGNTRYVEVFDPPLAITGNQGTPSLTAPRRATVTLGTSNDTSTEIASGIDEGTQVVTRTIAPSSGTSQSAPSILGGGTQGTRGMRF